MNKNKVDPYLRITANNNGETKCVIFVDNISKARELLQKHNANIVGAYPFISGFGANVNVFSLSDLSDLPFVRAIVSHSTVATTMDYANKLVGSDVLHNHGIYGKSTVAVIDTGISPHLDFTMPRNRIVKFVDFINGRQQPYDDNGHGTAVAGILCGNGLVSNCKYSGIAPRANIISLKAIGANGEGGAFSILEAMQWIYTNRQTYNISVACMSFGSTPLPELDPLILGVEALWQAGITVVASAGNSGPESNTIKSPGASPYIITVGGADCAGETPIVADFSSRGPIGQFNKPDVLAPGININCTGLGENYVALTGTSMSTPIVAGVCALIKSKHPNYTPDKVKELIILNTTKMDCDINSCGYGFLNTSFIDDL